jgi:hypothetical protein
LRIGASVTRTHYTLGRQFAALDVNGNATISTLYALHPLIRSLVGGLDTQVAFNYQDLSDVVGATDVSDRRWSRDVAVSLNGDIRDNILGGGVTSGSIAYVNGYLTDPRSKRAADRSGDCKDRRRVRKAVVHCGETARVWPRCRALHRALRPACRRESGFVREVRAGRPQCRTGLSSGRGPSAIAACSAPSSCGAQCPR